MSITAAVCPSPATPLCPSSCQLAPATNTVGPQFVTWAPDSNIAPLATEYVYTDGSGQSTSSSLYCNSDLFNSAYSTTVNDCSYSICPSQYLDPDCNLYIDSLVVNDATSISPTVQTQTASSGYWLNLAETYGGNYVTTTAYNGTCNLGCATALALFVASQSPFLYTGALTSISDNTYDLPDITSYAGSWVGFSCQTVALQQPLSFAAGLTTTVTTGDDSTNPTPTIPITDSTSSYTISSPADVTSTSTSLSTETSSADSSSELPPSTTPVSTTTTTASQPTPTVVAPDISTTSYSRSTVTSYTYITLPNGQTTSSAALTTTATVVVVPENASPTLQQGSDAPPFPQTNFFILVIMLIMLA